MEFTLYYHGELKSNGDPCHKHTLRQHFHRQLKALWKQHPLVDFKDLLTNKSKNNPLGLRRNLKEFNFVPLVAENIFLNC